MKNVKYLVLIIAFTNSLFVFSQKKLKLSDVLDIADKQRTLTQKIAKNQVFILFDKEHTPQSKELKNSILEFEFAIEILRNFAPNKSIKYKIDIQELAFKRYKRLILESSKQSINEVISINTLILQICTDVFDSFLSYSMTKSKEKNNPRIIESIHKCVLESGNIRYLTQRLSLYHAVNDFKLRTIYPDEIDEILLKIEKSINSLTISEFNTLEIDDTISKVLYYWGNLNKELKNSGKNKAGISKIPSKKLYNLSNAVLSKSKPLTKMYAQIYE